MPLSMKTLATACLLALSTTLGAAAQGIPVTPIDPSLPIGNQHHHVEHGGWVPGQADRVSATSCGAENFEHLVGGHHALQLLPGNAIVVHPGTIGAAIYLPQRLNIGVDETGYVTSVYCG